MRVIGVDPNSFPVNGFLLVDDDAIPVHAHSLRPGMTPTEAWTRESWDADDPEDFVCVKYKGHFGRTDGSLNQYRFVALEDWPWLTDSQLLEAATQRVIYDLDDIRAFCLADWPEGREHWLWLITADAAEIRAWAEAGGYKG